MTLNRIQSAAIALRQRRPTGQFGQAYSSYTVGGKYGCGHTLVQFIAELAGKGYWTQDAISKRVGYPNMSRRLVQYRRGMSTGEATAFLRSIGVPYHVEDDLSHSEVVAFSTRGPVLIVHQYRWWPEWKDYNYFGRIADGKPNGFAGPLRKAGANQVGADLAHWGAFIAQDLVVSNSSYVCYGWEPNHRSSSRPEPVPFDKFTPVQLVGVMKSRNGIVLVPDKPLPIAA